MHFTSTKSLPWILWSLKHKSLSSNGDFLTIAMYHHGETIKSKLTHYDETKKRLTTHKNRAKENLKLSHGRARQTAFHLIISYMLKDNAACITEISD